MSSEVVLERYVAVRIGERRVVVVADDELDGRKVRRSCSSIRSQREERLLCSSNRVVES